MASNGTHRLNSWWLIVIFRCSETDVSWNMNSLQVAKLSSDSLSISPTRRVRERGRGIITHICSSNGAVIFPVSVWPKWLREHKYANDSLAYWLQHSPGRWETQSSCSNYSIYPQCNSFKWRDGGTFSLPPSPPIRTSHSPGVRALILEVADAPSPLRQRRDLNLGSSMSQVRNVITGLKGMKDTAPSSFC